MSFPKLGEIIIDEDKNEWACISNWNYEHKEHHFMDAELENGKCVSFAGEHYSAKTVGIIEGKIETRYAELIVLCAQYDNSTEDWIPEEDDELENTLICYIQNSDGDYDCAFRKAFIEKYSANPFGTGKNQARLL